MKRYRDASGKILFFALIGLTILLINREAGMAKEFDASLNVTGYDRNVTVKINGIQLSRITGGQSQSARLFLSDDPLLKTLPPERREKMKELFCLKKGENIIEISFSEKGQPQSPSQFTVSVDSGNYKVPVLKYEKTPNVKEGKTKGIFTILVDQPAGFKTVILQ